MKKYLLILLTFSFLIVGCGQRMFELDPALVLNESYNVDKTGAFSETQEITRQQVFEAFDLPENAEVTDFHIEKMSLKVVVLENNVAKDIVASGRLQLGSSKPEIFKNYGISLEGVNDWFGLNDLIALGVSTLKSKIEGYIMGNDYEPFDIEIYGDSSPAGQKINVRIELKIAGTVKGKYCVETLVFFGEDCTL